MFRFLGLHPGPEITPAAAAALADVPLAQARPVLGELAAMNLLAQREPGRYAMHSLLRAFALELVAGEAAPEARRRALHRLYDYHLRWALEAEHAFVTMPTPFRADDVPLPPGLEPVPFADYNAGMAWFEAERAVLTALVAHAAAAGFEDHACRLAAAQSCGLMVHNRYHDAARQGRIALAAAKGLGDLRYQANGYFQIGRALVFTGELDTARFQLERALRIQRSLGDDCGLAETHRTLVMVHHDLDDLDKADHHAQRHLAVARRLGHQPSICLALHGLGWAKFQQGRAEEALELLGDALVRARRLRLRHEAAILDSLGTVHQTLGNLKASHDHYMSSADHFAKHESSDEYGHLLALADAHASAGRTEHAREIWVTVSSLAGDRLPLVSRRIEERLAALPAT